MSASRGGATYLFGAGGVGRWSLEYLRARGFKVEAFVDNSKRKQGTLIEGVPVISADEFSKRGKDCIVFVTAKHRVLEVMEQLRGADNVKYAMGFEAWETVHDGVERYENVERYLCDEKSHLVLEAMVNSKLTGDNKYLAAMAERNTYFCLPGFFGCPSNDTFVDVGYFTGDTIEGFIAAKIGCFEHIYGFDVGGKQLAAARSRIKRLTTEWALDESKITLVNACVGKAKGVLHISDEAKLNGMNISDDSGKAVDVVALDDYFKDVPISFLKADIEGSEMDMLLGAQSVIKRDRPKMALCVYHRCDDLVNMAELIRRCVPEYKFALRHHSAWQDDTVLYCWV